MTNKEWVELHKELTDKMREITIRKNADYATSGDAFSNFKLVQQFGVASAEQGFFTRMTDKMSRIASFIEKGELQVKDESVEDTLLDLANYSLLLIGYLRNVDKKLAEKGTGGTIMGTGDPSPITI
jgi:anti-sigma28 factor (negative regulator of flagellin synthesis)